MWNVDFLTNQTQVCLCWEQSDKNIDIGKCLSHYCETATFRTLGQSHYHVALIFKSYLYIISSASVDFKLSELLGGSNL